MEGVINDFLEGSIATIGKRPVIEEKTITSNGDYTAPTGVDGYSPIHVQVPPPNLTELNVSSNGTFQPSGSVDGYNKVVVSVPEPTYGTLEVTQNGTYIPTAVDGYNRVDVDVVPNLEVKEINENGTYIPSEGYDGFQRVIVDVPSLSIDYYKNNTLIYNTSNTQNFNYDDNKTLSVGFYILSLSWYDYNRDVTDTRLVYFNGTSAYIEYRYNYQFNITLYPSYSNCTLTSGVPFNLYAKLTKVFDSQFYT